MTAIVAGQGLGLTNTSLGLLGRQGQLGVAEQGGSGEKVVVNATTGNLVVQQVDEWLVGVGPDVGVSRTYNSLAQEDGDNNDNWRLGFSRKVLGSYSGTTGSTVQRVGEDGATITYTWNGSDAYVSKSGGGSFDTLTWSNNQWTWTDGDTRVQEVYEASGTANQYRLKSVKDTDGKALTLTYVASGLPSAGLINRITDSNGEYITIEYGGTNGLNIQSLTTWSSTNAQLLKQVSYAYDTSNRLTQVKVDLSPEDGATTDNYVYVTNYTYDGSSKRLQTLTQSGQSGSTLVVNSKLEFAYDTANKVKTVKETFGSTDIRTTEFTYGSGTTTIKDPLSQPTVLTYETAAGESQGQLKSIQLPAATTGATAQLTSFTYDSNGNVKTITDPRGYTVTYDYDSNGNRTYERDGAGNVVQRTYNAANQVLTETAYAVAGSIGGSIAPSGAMTTRYAYDTNQHLRFVVSPSGLVTEYKYDDTLNGSGQRSSAIQYSTASYSGTDYGLTALANWASGQSDKSGWLRTDYAYNGRGQLITETRFAKVNATTGAGITSDNTQVVTQYVYDTADGRLLQKIDGRGYELATLNTDWAKDTRPVVLKDANKVLASSLSPGDKNTLLALYTTTYTYDGLGRLLSQKDGLNVTTTTVYDDANLTTTVTLDATNTSTSGVSLVTVNTYDKAGRLLSVARSAPSGAGLGTTNYTYDTLGRLVAVKLPATGSSDTGQTSYIVYDAAGRKVADIDAEGALTEYTYNQDNQITKTRRYYTPVDSAKLTNSGVGLSLEGTNGLRPVTTGGDHVSLNVYDKAGRLTKTIDPLGAVVEYSYDGAGRLTSTQAYSKVLSATLLNSLYNSLDELAGQDGALIFSNEENGSLLYNLTVTTLNRRTRNFYNGNGQLIGQLDADNYYTQNTYDQAGRLIQSTRYATAISGTVPEGNTSPTPTAQFIQLQDVGQDQTTKYFYNGRGQLIGILDAERYHTAYTYDAAGNKSSEIRYANTLGIIATDGTIPTASTEDQKTTYTYDADNRLLSTLRQPSGLLVSSEYDAAGNLVKTTTTVKVTGQSDEKRAQQRRYDRLGRVTAELTGEGGKALDALGANPSAGAVDTVWNTYATRYVYDNAGRRIATIEPNGTDATGNQTVFYYDKVGRLTHSLNALGEVTEFIYDVFGQQTEQRRYAKRYANIASLGGGLKVSLVQAITDLRQDDLDSRVKSSYDLAGHLSWHSPLLGQDTWYSYNAFGEVFLQRSTVDAGEDWQSYTFDHRGNVTQTVDKDADQTVLRTTQAKYDAFGRLVRTSAPLGNITSYQYDRLGRQIKATSTGSSDLYQYTDYDAFGRVARQSDEDSQEYSEYTYDGANRTMTITTPDGKMTVSTLNSLGQVVKITDARGNVTTYDYNANGQLLSNKVYTKDSSTALTETLTAYDKAGRVSYTRDERYTYTTLIYDKANRVLSRSVGGQTTQYLYDAKGQAVWSKAANGAWTKTEFNRKGEITAVVIDPTMVPDLAVTTPLADGSQALKANSASGGGLNLRTEYTRASDGQLLKVIEGVGTAEARTTQYTYDVLGQRTTVVVDPNGLALTTQYTYDANGNVVVKIDPTLKVTRYVYDAGNRLSYQIDPAGDITRYEYETHGRVSRTTAYATRITLSGNDPVTAQTVSTLLGAPTADDRISYNAYDYNGRLAATVDARGNATRILYDEVGNVRAATRYAAPATVTPGSVADRVVVNISTLVTAGADQLTQTVYDAANRVICEVDPEGGVTYTSYSADNLTITQRKTYNKVVYPAGKTRLDINVQPDLVSSAPSPVTKAYVIQDARDQVTITELDTTGRVQATRDAELYWTEYGYDAVGNVNLVTRYNQPNARDSESTAKAVNFNVYDRAGRQTDTTEAYGETEASTTHTAYDALGNAVDVTEAYNKTADASRTHYVYDKAGRQTEVTRGYQTSDATTTKTTYDNAGRITDVTVASGTLDASTTHYLLDDAGRVTAEYKAYGLTGQAITRYVLDAFGQRTKIIDPRGAEAAEGTSDWAVTERSTSTPPAVGSMAYQALLDRYTTTQTFDKLGHITKTSSVLDQAAGTKVEIVTDYDAFGNAVKVTDPNGNPGYFYFNRLNQATWQIDPMGYATQTEYNALGQVEAITKYVNPVGNPGTLTAAALPTLYTQAQFDAYKASHSNQPPATAYLVSNADAVSGDQRTTILHDKVGRQTQITDAASHAEYMTYDGLGNKLTYTNKLGGQYTYTYDKRGNLLTETLPVKVKQYDVSNAPILEAGSVKLNAVINKYTYDARGNRLTSTEAWQLNEQRQTTYTYDKLDRMVSQTGGTVPASVLYDTGVPASTATQPGETRRYDAQGNLIEVKTAGSARTLSYYDAQNRKVAELNPMGALSTYAYDTAGNLIMVSLYGDLLDVSAATAGGTVPTPPNATNVRQTFYTYDTNRRQTSTRIKSIQIGDINTSTGNYEVRVQDLVTRQQYDRNGNVVANTDARGNVIWHYYDKLGHQILQVDAERYATQWTYDAAGNAIDEVRYAQKLGAAVTVNADSTASNLLSGLSTTGARETKWTRDKLGQVLTQTVVGVETATYSATGVLGTSYKADATTQFQYNEQGNLKQKQEATGEILNWTYDQQGRQIKRQGSSFTDYTDATSQGQTIETEYNGVGLAVRTLEKGKTSAIDRIKVSTFDLNGVVTSMIDANGNVTYYKHDVDGHITQKSITRLAADSTYSTDITTYRYDKLGRQTGQSIYGLTGNNVALPAGATVLRTQDAAYNAYGEVTGKSTNGAWEEYAQYDNAGRAIKTNTGTGATKAYVFDANGNVTLTIESTGADLKPLTMVEILRRSDLFETVTTYDRRNQLTDTYQAKQTIDGTQTWQSASAPTGVDGVLIDISGAATPPASASTQDLMAIGSFDYVKPEIVSIGGTVKKATLEATNLGNVPFSNVGNITATIAIPDTSAMGSSPVSIWMETLHPQPINSQLNEYAGTLQYTFADEDQTIKTDDFNLMWELYYPQQGKPQLGTVTATGGTRSVKLGAALLKNSTLNTLLHITKNVNGTVVELVPPISVQFKDGVNPDIQIESTDTEPSVLLFKEQPTNAVNVVMNYRLKGSNDPWTVKSLQKGAIDANGNTSFWLQTNDGSMPPNLYEMRYVALGVDGKILNSEEGTLQVTDVGIFVNQTPRQALGSAGQAFVDTQGQLNVSEQSATAVSATWTITPTSGGASKVVAAAPATINGTAIPGWFKLPTEDPIVSALAANTYNYTLTSKAADGQTTVQVVSGTFTKTGSALSTNGNLVIVQAPPANLTPIASLSAIDASSISSVTGTLVKTAFAEDKTNSATYMRHTAYSAIGGQSINVAVPDTSALGPGNVYFELTALNPQNIYPQYLNYPLNESIGLPLGQPTYDENGDIISRSTTVYDTITGTQLSAVANAATRSRGNTTGAQAQTVNVKLGGFVLKDGMLQSVLRMYKDIGNGQRIEVGTAIQITMQDGPAPFITVGQSTGSNLLTVKALASGTDRVVMTYRENSSAPWKFLTLNKSTALDAGNVAQFWASTAQSGIPASGTPYEMRYFALSTAGNILDTGEGTMLVSSSGITVSQTSRVIGNPGLSFIDSNGNLNIAEQGVSAAKASLVITPASGGTAVTVPLTAATIGGKVTPGWFQLPFSSISGLAANTYNYVLTSLGADGQTVVQKISGSFTKSSTSLSANGALTMVQAPSTWAVTTGQFISNSVSLVSLVTATVKRTVFPSVTNGQYPLDNHEAYSAVGGLSVTLAIPDTSYLGSGLVYVERVPIGAKQVSGYTTELVGSPRLARDPETDAALNDYDTLLSATFNYTLNRPVTASAQGQNLIVPLGGYVLKDKTLQSELQIYKDLGNGQRLYLGTAMSVLLTDGPTPTITVGDSSGTLLAVSGQPMGTDRLVMSYRIKDSGDAWTRLPLNKGLADAAGAPQFWLSTLQSGIAVNTYEMRYVALSGNGSILNSGEGTMAVSSSGVTVNQTARHIGGAGQAFIDKDGYLNIAEQSVMGTNATLSVRLQNGTQNTVIPLLTSTPASIAGKVTPGWYRFRLSDLGLVAGTSYSYVFEAFGKDGKSATSLVQGNFTAGNASSVTQPQVPAKYQRVVFKNLPATAAYGQIRYTAKQPGSPTLVSPLQLTGTSELTWSAFLGNAPSQDYDISYDIYDANGNVLRSGQQTIFMGDQSNRTNTPVSTTTSQVIYPALGLLNASLTTHKTNKYNAFGEIEEATDTLNHTTTFSYNTLGKLVKKEDPYTDIVSETGESKRDRPTTSYYYDLQGRQVAITDANQYTSGQHWAFESADGQSHLADEQHADHGIKYSRYDVFGDLIESVNESWDGTAANKKYYTTTYAYDNEHQVTKVTRPLRKGGAYTTAGYDRYVYDALGNRIAHYASIDDVSTNEIKDTTFYDAAGRVIQIVSGQSRNTKIVYEDAVTVTGLNDQLVIGQRITTINDNDTNNKLIDEKDAFGHVTKHTDLGSHVYTYTYNAAGWLTQQASSNKQKISYQYYSDGRLKKISDTALMTYSMYQYDSEGNKTRESYATWFDENVYQQATIAYDELNRIKSITDPQYTLQFEYDAVGNKRHLVSTVTSNASANQDFWYRYDGMNRFIVTMGTLSGTRGAAGTKIIAGATGGAGVLLEYDKLGQRTQASMARDGHSERYYYTTDGFLETTKLTVANKFSATPTANAPNGTLPVDADYWMAATRDSDLMGRVKTYKEYIAGGIAVANTHTYDYDKDSKVKTDVLKTPNGSNTVTVETTYDMLKDGTVNSIHSKQTTTANGLQTDIYTYYGYEWWESAKQSTITSQPYNSQAPGWKAGTSSFTYDLNGFVSSAIDAGSDAIVGTSDDRVMRYINNAQGLVLSRTEAAAGQTKLQTYYYVNGARVGETGPDVAGTVDYAQALAISASAPLPPPKTMPFFQRLAMTLSTMATSPGFSYQQSAITPVNFDQSYQPIGSSYPAFTSNGYTVSSNDEKLESIARAVWGDGSLWYLIAEANGLMSANAALVKGQTLVIPNKVTNVHNSSSTVKVYDPNEALGNVSPTLPEPPPPPNPKKGCGGIGMILMVVVTVVVSVLTAGAALAALGPVMAGALGGAVGSIAGQLVGMAAGVVDKFSWSSVAQGAIGGAIGGAVFGVGDVAGPLSETLKTSSEIGTTILRSVATNVMTQGASMVVGLQKQFSWTSVATSAVGAAASYGVQEAIGNAQWEGQWDNRLQASPLGDAARTAINGDWVGGTLRGTTSNLVGSWAGSMVAHKKVDWSSAAVSSFGSALGDSIVGSIQRADASKVPPVASAEEKAQILAGFAGGPGGEGATSYPVRMPGQMDVGVLPPSDGGDSPERQAHLARIMRLANDPAALGSGGAPFRVSMGGTRADMTNADFELANQVAVDIASRNGEDLAPTIANAARLRLEAVNGGVSGVELAQRFGQGLMGAVKGVTVEPVLQVRDMGAALASVTYNELLRDDGDAMWFPEMKSGMAQASANGASQGRLLLQSNPITALPAMGYDLGIAVRNSDWGTVAEMSGGVLGGLAIGAGVKRYGGYGIAFDDVSGPMQSQMGAINPRLVTPASEANRLTYVGQKTWESPEGLQYGPDPQYGNRVEHVLRHAADQPQRAGEHGVFDSGRSGVVSAVDEAWIQAQRGGTNVVKTSVGTKDTYVVDMGRRVGWVGGQGGAALGNPVANKVMLIVRNGNQVVTSYPIR